MCTHLLLEAEGLADQVVVLEDGHRPHRRHADGADRALLARRRRELDAEDPSASLDRSRDLPGVRRTTTTATTRPRSSSTTSTASPTSCSRSPRDGVRLTRVEPHQPTLEDLYFAVRGRKRPEGGIVAPRHHAPSTDVRLLERQPLGRGFRDAVRGEPRPMLEPTPPGRARRGRLRPAARQT